MKKHTSQPVRRVLRRRIRPGTRRGISLTEVLIATFVAVLGVVALAALVPVGIHEVNVAARADMTAMVGRNAWRDIKVRDWLRGYDATRTTGFRSLWYFHNGGSLFNDNGTNRNPPSNPPNIRHPFAGTSGIDAFAIDPLVAAHPQSTPGGDWRRGEFPFRVEFEPSEIDSNPYFRMARLTIRASEYDTYNGMTRGLAAYEYAKRLFMPDNELIFTPPDDDTGIARRSSSKGADGAPGQAGTDDDGDGLTDEDDGSEAGYWDDVAESGGDYSWMMTVSPSFTDYGATYTVAIVVFYQRNPVVPRFPIAERIDNPPNERCTYVDLIGTGGDVLLRWTAGEGDPDMPGLHVDDWVMFFGRLRDGSGNPTGPKIVQWYKVLGIDDGPYYNSGTGEWGRAVTLEGPNWDTNFISPPFAVVYDRAVGVYQKTIQLK